MTRDHLLGFPAALKCLDELDRNKCKKPKTKKKKTAQAASTFTERYASKFLDWRLFELPHPDAPYGRWIARTQNKQVEIWSCLKQQWLISPSVTHVEFVKLLHEGIARPIDKLPEWVTK